MRRTVLVAAAAVAIAALAGAEEVKTTRTERLIASALEWQKQGKFEEAEAAIRRALDDVEKLPADDPDRLLAYNNAGMLFHEKCRPDDAERFYRKALAFVDRQPEADPNVLATVLTNLGVFYLDTRQISRASRIQERMAEVIAKPGIRTHHRVRFHTITGRLHARKGDLVKAEAEIRAGLALAQEARAEPIELSGPLYDLGVVQIKSGRAAEAVTNLNSAVKLIEEYDSPTSPAIVGVLFALATAHRDTGNQSDALRVSDRALGTAAHLFTPRSAAYAIALEVHAATLAATRHKKEAKQARREAADIYAVTGRPSTPQVVDLWSLR